MISGRQEVQFLHPSPQLTLLEEIMGKVKEGDWVKVNGEGNEAFTVEWINKGTVGLSNHNTEPLHKVIKLDLNKYKIDTYTVHYWRKKD